MTNETKPCIVGSRSITSLAAGACEAAPDLSKEKVLYCVPYAHLDTQWRWDYVTTIGQYIKYTLDDNFKLLEKYPEYKFTFTGSIRYEMMKEYYPEKFEKLKEYVKQGRWCVGGSSVDEGDVNVPSPESVIRQVLYGNHWFRKEFGADSVDYMLPDCFGFPASMPSVWAHCGLRGFSTQKLYWGCAVGVPFSVGIWIGPDGKGVICAFDPGSYGDGVPNRLDIDPHWVGMVNANGEKYGVFTNYHYFGVGDQGGAPREPDVQMAIKSMNNPDGQIKVVMAASDQMYKDITDQQAAKLPTYKGDLLLKEHSAGSLTSQCYMKRWNRKNEILADSAERAAVAADWLGLMDYPIGRINSAWARVLGSQFHDILPGTSLPRAYEYSWNDEIIALNIFGHVLESSAGAVIGNMDTRAEGVPVVVYNPLAVDRDDIVEASVEFPKSAPKVIEVLDAKGKSVPCQILERKGKALKIAFVASVKPVSYSVFDVRSAEASEKGTLKVTKNLLENEYYKVAIDTNGDVSSIFDKKLKKELLAAPAQLQFLHESPREWPAWNMDWDDRQKPPIGAVDGPAEIKIIENGPARVALQITRSAKNSIFTQQIRLACGEAGRRIEFKNYIDWQSTGVSLKAAFPLAASNSVATYNLGLGTIDRANNNSVKYEVPSREWFDLTNSDGSFGVSVLEDCKFGSDKPNDNTLRLTMLYSPEVNGGGYKEQYSQDWGRHDITYALYGHKGDWADGGTKWQGRRLNQPLVGFQVQKHEGPLGRQFSMASVSTNQVDIRAFKKAEDGDFYIVRIQELFGKPAANVSLSFAAPVAEAYEVDGQERRIGDAKIDGGKLVTDTDKYQIRSFAVKLQAPKAKSLKAVQSHPIKLEFNESIATSDSKWINGKLDSDSRTIPLEELPKSINCDGIRFELGLDAEKNAVACSGQTIDLPSGGNAVHLLITAANKTEAEFKSGRTSHKLTIPAWTGFVGQFDNRVWDKPFGEVDHEGKPRVIGLTSGYIQRDPVAWFCTHRHHPKKGNEAYQFSYLFVKRIPLAPGVNKLTLPNNPDIKIVAMTVANDLLDGFKPAQPLYDDFSERGEIIFRK